MNLLDVAIVVILLYCLIRGFFRGIIKETASLAGVMIGFLGARMYYKEVSQLFSGWISNAGYREILGFLLIFVTLFFIVALIGIVARYLMKVVFLGWLDRLLGVVFGFFKGILIVSIIFLTLASFLPKGASILTGSSLSPIVNKVSDQMSILVSKEMRSKYGEKMKELKRKWTARS